NRAFKTSAVEIYPDSDIDTIIERAFIKLMIEKDEYSGRGSGFTMVSIDGLLLAVYKYTPMSGSSYIELPAYIDRKRATINPQNNDEQCFKWAILGKHVTGLAKNNRNVSINVYGLDKKFQIPKLPRYEVYPLRIVDEEKKDHFDLLLITDGDNSHYTYISNFSRLIRKQKTRHDGHVVFCKRCFTSFDNQNLKYKLSGQEALDQHKLICGVHKPILPEMSKEGECLQFEAWKKTQRHPIHEAMSYRLIVKASDDVPVELLDEYEITKEPVIYRGSKSKTNVAKHFIETVTELAIKIEKLLKTNEPIVFTDEQRQSHDTCTACNLCKINFTYDNHKVADHCHLSGKYRQALLTELGHDTKAINVIPNSEEKYISFSKYVSNTFSMRFIDTFRFMASGLSTLAKILTTPGLENFCETAKYIVVRDMPLVTRKGIYPYEYTDSWERLKDRRLPRKRDFYSTLTETGVTESDFEHAKL
ncbi:Uncharacterized protein FWK35_00035255, partial [Aphis craccivora]